ncbi:MAG: hypothetical protein AAGG09_12905 [Pseudomonadota bacterium]
MEVRTVGDLTQQLVARQQNAELRREMDRLVFEVGTEKRADLAGSLRGDFTLLSGVEADLSRLQAFAETVSDLELRGEAIQRVLSAGRELGNDTTANLLTASPPTTAENVAFVASEARGRFADFAARLNGSFAGASLFAGTATGGPAVAPAEDMLTALEAEIAPLTSVADVQAAIETWFAPGGGYDTLGYVGSADPLPSVDVSPTRQIGLGVTAADPEVRDVLTGLAMAALTDRPPLLGDLEVQGDFMIAAAERIQKSQSGLAELQARLGTSEAELEGEAARNAAEQAVLRTTRAEMTDVDIFEAATDLDAVQARLELLYTITARSAQLSLVRVLG